MNRGEAREREYRGKNRTGVQEHPELAQTMLDATAEFRPTSKGDDQNIAEIRVEYAREGMSVGSMPESSQTAPELLSLLDRLGARLAFERAGVRLYEAVISKLDAYGTWNGGPQRAQLAEIRGQELEHEHLARELINELRGDPTAVTPAANLQLVALRGVLEVCTDPRTDLRQCMEAVLVAELTDQESWSVLARLIEEVPPRPEVVKLRSRVAQAVQTESQHLEKVREWLAAARRE